MTSNTLVSLINNAALLLSLSVLHDMLSTKTHWRRPVLQDIGLGSVLGIIGLVVMLTPLELWPGLIFDTRSILLCLTGLFFGLIPTLISIAITAGYRFYLGGVGMWPGVMVILFSGGVGLLWRSWHKDQLDTIRFAELYVLGIVVHLVMLVCMLLLPDDVQWEVIGTIGLPVMLIHPFATALLGSLMSRRQRHKRLKIELSKSEQRYRKLFEQTNEAIFEIDKGTRHIVNTNRAGEWLTGHSITELKYMNLAKLLAEPSLKEQDIDAYLQTDKALDIGEVRFALPNGDYKIALLTIVPLQDNSVFGIAQDVTSYKNTLAQLKSSEERFRLAFQTSPDSISISRLHDGLFVDINEGFETVLGYNREEVIGHNIYELKIWYDPSERLKMVAELEKNQLVNNLELKFRTKDGTVKVALLSAHIIMLEQEAHLIAIIRDISQRKEMEESLRATNQELAEALEQLKAAQNQMLQQERMAAVGKLAGGIAHDFNNILVPILGYAKLSQREVEDDSSLYQNLDYIRESAERAANLTRQILAFSRRQVLEMTIFNLNDVVANFAKMLQRIIGEDIELSLNLAEKLAPIKADRTQIEQVLLNLAVNARDAMPQGGQLNIETSNIVLDKTYVAMYPQASSGPHVMLSVSDTGVGMTAETQQRIFEPFYTTKDPGKGTGLGLATVFGIVKQHQGNIWVHSQIDGGTTFNVYLPQSQPEAASLPAENNQHLLKRRQGTILVLEDERLTRKLLSDALRKQGYYVLSAATPSEGLELAVNYPEPIYLLLTDVILPEMNGRAFYERFSEIHPQSQVLYMSGYTNDIIGQHGVLESDIQFLQKPFTVDELLERIDKILQTA